MTDLAADPRLARQRAIPDLGPAALPRLAAARIHVVGAGPTAGPALLALAQAGVGGLLLDDGADVRGDDAASGLYLPGDAGAQRPLAARAALLAAGARGVRLWASETRPTAALVCAESEGTVRAAADQARRAGVPHVVALAWRGGGEVVVVPPGAPCFRCASPPSGRVMPAAGDRAAVGALAALELLQLLLRPAARDGRRVELAAGVPAAGVTARRPGCDCANV